MLLDVGRKLEVLMVSEERIDLFVCTIYSELRFLNKATRIRPDWLPIMSKRDGG